MSSGRPFRTPSKPHVIPLECPNCKGRASVPVPEAAVSLTRCPFVDCHRVMLVCTGPALPHYPHRREGCEAMDLDTFMRAAVRRPFLETSGDLFALTLVLGWFLVLPLSMWAVAFASINPVVFTYVAVLTTPALVIGVGTPIMLGLDLWSSRREQQRLGSLRRRAFADADWLPAKAERSTASTMAASSPPRTVFMPTPIPPGPRSWQSRRVRTTRCQPIGSAIFLVLCSTVACPRPTDTEAASVGIDPKVDPTTSSASGAETPARSGVLKVDRSRSSVGFAVARATVGHIGKFDEFDASLELRDEQPVGLEISVKTGSVAADRHGLTSHLKSADFFHVDKFPTATFTAEQFTADAEAGPDAYVIAGTMHLHGVGRKLEFPATLEIRSDQVVGRATLDISAKAFGIDYEGMEAELAEDEVQLEIELVFPRVAVPVADP
jgi:polyisoprenoid-binding protein YceI